MLKFSAYLTESRSAGEHVFHGHESIAAAERHLLALHDALLGKKSEGIKFHTPLNINPKNYSPEEQTAFMKHLNLARKAYMKMKPEALETLEPYMDDIKSHAKRSKHEPGTIDSLLAHVTRKSGLKESDEHSKKVDHLLSSRDHVNTALELHHHLQNAQNVLAGVAGRSNAVDGDHIKMSDETGNRTKIPVEKPVKLRQGITHPMGLKHEDLSKLLATGRLKGAYTEKTDGMAFAIGHDENGFYTRTSHSAKMRNAGDYEKAARERFGDDFDPSISQHFDRIHRALENNPKLRKHLENEFKNRGNDTTLKGEMFYKPHGTPVGKNGLRFVGTTYDRDKMGGLGSFILHSRLPENQGHDVDKITKLGDKQFKFDHDVIDKSHVDEDVTDLKERLGKINVAALHSRKKDDAKLKERERQKVAEIAMELENRMRKHTSGFKKKWGPETEGHVFHPDVEAPLIKLTSDTFQQFKANKGKPTGMK